MSAVSVAPPLPSGQCARPQKAGAAKVVANTSKTSDVSSAPAAVVKASSDSESASMSVARQQPQTSRTSSPQPLPVAAEGHHQSEQSFAALGHDPGAFLEAVLEAAGPLGIDVDSESHLLWLAGLHVENNVNVESGHPSLSTGSDQDSEQLLEAGQNNDRNVKSQSLTLSDVKDLATSARRVEGKIVAADPTLLDSRDRLQAKLEAAAEKIVTWEGRCTAVTIENGMLAEQLRIATNAMEVGGSVDGSGGASGGTGTGGTTKMTMDRVNEIVASGAAPSQQTQKVKQSLDQILTDATEQPNKVLVASLVFAREETIRQAKELMELKSLMRPLAMQLQATNKKVVDFQAKLTNAISQLEKEKEQAAKAKAEAVTKAATQAAAAVGNRKGDAGGNGMTKAEKAAVDKKIAEAVAARDNAAKAITALEKKLAQSDVLASDLKHQGEQKSVELKRARNEVAALQKEMKSLQAASAGDIAAKSQAEKAALKKSDKLRREVETIRAAVMAKEDEEMKLRAEAEQVQMSLTHALSAARAEVQEERDKRATAEAAAEENVGAVTELAASNAALQDRVAMLEAIALKLPDLMKTVRAAKAEIAGVRCDSKGMVSTAIEYSAVLSNELVAYSSFLAGPNANLVSPDSERMVEALKLGAMPKEKMLAWVKAFLTKNAATQSRARKLQATVQDLQGGIRVYCRIRPLVQRENGEAPTLTMRDDDTISAYSTGGKNKDFAFDSIFGTASTQEQVFEKTCPLIMSVLDGYNACVFAYGPTGSGKTHTMAGHQGGDQRGLTYRSLEEIFRAKDEMESVWDIELTMSMFEIYNETIRDLLAASGSAPRVGGVGGGATPGKGKDPRDVGNKEVAGLAVRGDASGVYIEGLSAVGMDSIETGSQLMELAAKSRAQSGTNLNELSSRSHLLVLINARCTNRASGNQRSGKLYLIDLAGCENVGKSGVQGQAFKEAASINKSLSALHDVMGALAEGRPHIPYRNSKLTYVLADALGGNAKCLMYVMVSPALSSSKETMSALNFAARCKTIVLGPPKQDAVESIVAGKLSIARSEGASIERGLVADELRTLSRLQDTVATTLRKFGVRLPKPTKAVQPDDQEGDVTNIDQERLTKEASDQRVSIVNGLVNGLDALVTQTGSLAMGHVDEHTQSPGSSPHAPSQTGTKVPVPSARVSRGVEGEELASNDIEPTAVTNMANKDRAPSVPAPLPATASPRSDGESNTTRQQPAPLPGSLPPSLSQAAGTGTTPRAVARPAGTPRRPQSKGLGHAKNATAAHGTPNGPASSPRQASPRQDGAGAGGGKRGVSPRVARAKLSTSSAL